MKLFPQKWMLPRDLRDGWERCRIGGGGTKALGRAASGLRYHLLQGLATGKANVRSVARWRLQAVLKVSLWNQRGGMWGRVGAGAASDRVLGWEGAVQERTWEHILMIHGFEASEMKLLWPFGGRR